MKKTRKTLKTIIAEIAKVHLGTDDLSSNPLIQTALEEAVKKGEHEGYNIGYNDAKQACGKEHCDCEQVTFTDLG